MRRSIASLLLVLGGAAAADPHSPTAAWPDSFVARLQALALLETLNSDLLSHDSATLTLEHWCGQHRLATPARVVAQRIAGPAKAASPEQRRELDISDAEPVRYRHVRLSCGAVVLSEAENWYVPGRLTSAMNEQLDTTDMPFGKVVQALHFQRHTLSAQLLWQPLEAGWEMLPRAAQPRRAPGGATLTIPPQVLQHRALLTLPDGAPISEVIETYSGAVLAFQAQSSPN